MTSHWERKMNAYTKPKASPRRKPATREQFHQAFDLISDGTSRREAARTTGVAESSIKELPGWGPKEVGEWARMTPSRRKVVGE